MWQDEKLILEESWAVLQQFEDISILSQFAQITSTIRPASSCPILQCTHNIEELKEGESY